MRMKNLLFLAACAGIFGSCAATVPRELVDAREAYQRASTGLTAKVAPTELHIAKQALVLAERSFEKTSDSYETQDLAYLALRKSEIAEATASFFIEQKNQSRERNEHQETQGEIVTVTKLHLNQTPLVLAESEGSGELMAEQLHAEQMSRDAAEQQAVYAQTALASLVAVREEPRGMVITLLGSVLFASKQTTLLPNAGSRLDPVATVLLTTRERYLTIEGHTDSQGADSANIALSQGRADAVRSYLVQRGYQADHIQSLGLGEGHPIADNGTAEGRANNRRVDIVIERGLVTSSQ